MDSVWMIVEEEQENQTEPFLGIFTQDPAEIASRLPRPKTPFQPIVEIIPLNDDFGKIKNSIETNPFVPMSPPSNLSFGFERVDNGTPYVSIF